MTIPPGFQPSNVDLTNNLCKLHKCLYELKKASRQWNHKLTSTLLTLVYTQSQTDHSLFVKASSSNITALRVYVDDLVLAGTDMTEITRVKQLLNDSFCIKDLGALRFFP